MFPHIFCILDLSPCMRRPPVKWSTTSTDCTAGTFIHKFTITEKLRWLRWRIIDIIIITTASYAECLGKLRIKWISRLKNGAFFNTVYKWKQKSRSTFCTPCNRQHIVKCVSSSALDSMLTNNQIETYCNRESNKGMPPIVLISFEASWSSASWTRHHTTFHNSLMLSLCSRLKPENNTIIKWTHQRMQEYFPPILEYF
jgi:hypothetical protein